MAHAGVSGKTTKTKADQFDLICPLLKAMFKEFQELSKKKPEGQVGKMKVQMVNRLLKPIHELLADEGNIAYLDLLEEDDLPQNSDVILVLGQTVAAMDAFRAKYYGWDNRAHDHVWFV